MVPRAFKIPKALEAGLSETPPTLPCELPWATAHGSVGGRPGSAAGLVSLVALPPATPHAVLRDGGGRRSGWPRSSPGSRHPHRTFDDAEHQGHRGIKDGGACANNRQHLRGWVGGVPVAGRVCSKLHAKPTPPQQPHTALPLPARAPRTHDSSMLGSCEKKTWLAPKMAVITQLALKQPAGGGAQRGSGGARHAAWGGAPTAGVPPWCVLWQHQGRRRGRGPARAGASLDSGVARCKSAVHRQRPAAGAVPGSPGGNAPSVRVLALMSVSGGSPHVKLAMIYGTGCAMGCSERGGQLQPRLPASVHAAAEVQLPGNAGQSRASQSAGRARLHGDGGRERVGDAHQEDVDPCACGRQQRHSASMRLRG